MPIKVIVKEISTTSMKDEMILELYLNRRNPEYSNNIYYGKLNKNIIK